MTYPGKLGDLFRLTTIGTLPRQTQGIQMASFRSMPEQYRQVLELKFLLEWSDEMIAQKLGLTLNATYTRISRGKKLLRERLIQEGYADETN